MASPRRHRISRTDGAASSAIGLTVQLGDGALLARETGIAVVHDMRANDMEHGGQGAPLVPAYHAALARSLPREFAATSRSSSSTSAASPTLLTCRASGDPIAFDTGAGKHADRSVGRARGGVPFDAGGAIASEGGVIRSVVERYLDNPFFEKIGPKSLDRNDFTLAFVEGLELADGARTLAAVSAEAILKSVDHLPERPKLWIVCGGGRKNPHIVGDLSAGAEKNGAKVIVAEDAKLNGDATEAEAWAYLAVRSMKGLPLTFPTTTGCREPVTGGILRKPEGAQ